MDYLTTGRLIISKGSDFKLRGATSGSTSDTGDIIWEDSEGVELFRLYTLYAQDSLSI